MDIRNPVFTSDNRIDCEIEHPFYGWIPFTADPNDVEVHGQEIYAVALAMGPVDYVAPAVVPPTKEQQEQLRKWAYTAEADPLFFMSQRDEATVEEWQAKVQEIKARYPYPEETQA